MLFRAQRAYENGLGYRSRGRTRSFALVEPKSPRSRLLFGEEHAREIFAICASLRRTAEGDSHGSFVSAVLRTGCA